MKRQRNLAVVVNPSELPRQKKQPRQARSKFTLDVILEAAEQLLLQEGSLDAVTTRHVALRAGVGIGTLYDYFPNRDAILIQLLNRRMRKQCEEAVPKFYDSLSRSLPELFLAGAEQAIEMDRMLLRYGRDFHRRYARHFFFGTYYPEISSPKRERFLAKIEELAVELLASKADMVREKDIDLAAFLISRALRGMISSLIEERPELLASPALAPLLQRVMLAIADCETGELPPSSTETEQQRNA
ncbi:MAG: helix-turn-helix domain containing protein [Rhodocyclales bacterium]|nr:helix-turn-helix domain containing protein [Rhodocyclales bacterium]